MKRRRFLEGVSVGTAASLAGCPGGAERVETRQTEEPEATGSDPATPEETTTETREESSGSGVDANWPEFDGLPKLIPELKDGDALAIVPGEMRPDYGLEQDPYTWWQVVYEGESHEEISGKTIDDVGALENDPGEVRKGGTTEIKGVDLHYAGDKYNYPAGEGWDSLSEPDNENSKRALGILRAAQKGDNVEVFNVDSGELIGEMFSEGRPDAIWVSSEYSDYFKDTKTYFGAIYDKEEGATYSEKSAIWNPKYKDGVIKKGMTDEETIYRGEGASWEKVLDSTLRDP